MTDEPGFTIGQDFYPFPASFRLGDPVLVSEVTGLAWNDFSEMLDSGDARTLAGLVAVAVWQKNPTWRRERVVRYVEALEMDALIVQGGGEDEDVVPPLVAVDTAITAPSPEPSTPNSDTSEASGTNHGSTGLQPSEISAA